jgi:hypothetical protein
LKREGVLGSELPTTQALSDIAARSYECSIRLLYVQRIPGNASEIETLIRVFRLELISLCPGRTYPHS